MSYLVKYGGKAVIHILVEESYRGNNRTDALLQGISAVIKRKRMSIEVHTKIADVPQGVRVVILLCASMAWAVETIEELYGRGIHPLLFGFQNIDTPYAYSCITPSYAKAMYLLTEQLLSKCAEHFHAVEVANAARCTGSHFPCCDELCYITEYNIGGHTICGQMLRCGLVKFFTAFFVHRLFRIIQYIRVIMASIRCNNGIMDPFAKDDFPGRKFIGTVNIEKCFRIAV